MGKIIGRTILKTAVGLLIVLAVAFTVASLGFPQHMATAFENVGAYRVATGYASLRYAYTDDIGDLDRCARDSILSGSDKNIVKYCGKLVKKEGFDALCEKQGGEYDYRQYIYGNLASSQYRRGDTEGSLASAVEAMEGVTGFPVNNALAILAIRAAEKQDDGMAALLLPVLEGIQPSEGEEEYYQKVKNILQI